MAEIELRSDNAAAVAPEILEAVAAANAGSALAFKDMQVAAAGIGLRVVSMPVEQSAEVERALQLARREGVQALQVHPTPGVGAGWRARIVEVPRRRASQADAAFKALLSAAG